MMGMIMISGIYAKDVLSHCYSVLNVAQSVEEINENFLIALIRRTAGYLCPCTPNYLRTSILESLAYLHTDTEDSLDKSIEQLIDDLIVSGDLLELSDTGYADTERKGSEIFAAPPSFIIRDTGRAYIIGIVKDQDKYFSDELLKRVKLSYNIRYIDPNDGEILSETLNNAGYIKLEEHDWLKLPEQTTSLQLLQKAKQKLATQDQCSPIEGLEVLNSAKQPTFYNGRWTGPKDLSGMYIARRPREFGPLLWGLVELEGGVLKRMLELPLVPNRWSERDDALHIQMALDRQLKQSQRYRITKSHATCKVEFFSPLPVWAERRYVAFGKKYDNKIKGALFAYDIPVEEIEQEEAFLQNYLWLAPYDDGAIGKEI